MSLEQRLDEQVTLALNVCRTADGYQASLERRTGVFSVRVAETPSAAIAAVLGEPEREPPAKDERQAEMSFAPPSSVFD